MTGEPSDDISLGQLIEWLAEQRRPEPTERLPCGKPFVRPALEAILRRGPTHSSGPGGRMDIVIDLPADGPFTVNGRPVVESPPDAHKDD